MKKKNFLVLALAAFTFAACSNEDIVPGGEDNNDVVNLEGDAWVALSVQSTKTRAINTPNQENGTPDESTITAVSAVFFTGHTDASVVTRIVKFTDDDITNLPNRTSAFKVPKTSKAVLIIANPQNLNRTIQENDTYGTVNKVVTLTTEAEVTTGVAKSGGFVMTNAKGDLEPSDTDGSPKDLELFSTATAATSSPLTIRIDRVSAKVRVYVKADSGEELSDVATIDTDGTGWYLNVTNKKFYPASKRTKTAMNTWTPYDQYGLGSYRKDPNFGTGTAIGAWSDSDPSVYAENYFYVSSATKDTDIAWNKVNTTAKYCLENTQDEDFNKHAYTTQALLKVSYAPTTITNADDTKVTLANGTDWFNMNGIFYTQASVLTYIEEELTNKYTHKAPAEYATDITDAYNEYIEALSLTPVTIPAAKDDTKTAEEMAEELKGKFEALAASIATASEGGKALKGVEYYSKGICYYKIMIKHDDSPTVMNKLGEFGVVRNSVYDITVNKINNPGYPSIPDPDPSAPDEEEDRYLSIKIEVNPWTWYSQVEPL
ncbi:Mfa1 family fimbria major subunit [Bacteroides congonensis]|uniref:Mfa1 family fimbria major subunit n=1 Tax=Bacteroides congonensis TaxID=1871006 RepID=UPI00189D86D8|nr:Mfa1 family fimbria major subunit [Bacteroides congonensis]